MNTENMKNFVKSRLDFYDRFDFTNQMQELNPYSRWEWHDVLLQSKSGEKFIAFICVPEPMMKIYGRIKVADDDLERSLFAPMGGKIFVPDAEKTMEVIKSLWKDKLPEGELEVVQVLPFDKTRCFQFKNSVEWLLGGSHLPMHLWSRPASDWQPEIIEREKRYQSAFIVDLRPWFKDFLGADFIRIMDEVKSSAMKQIGERPEIKENCSPYEEFETIRDQETWDYRQNEIAHMFDKYDVTEV